MKYALSHLTVAMIVLATNVAAEEDRFEGQVVNPRSHPVKRVQVEVYRLDDPRQRLTMLTNENGGFSLPLRDLVPPKPNALLQNHPNPFNPSTQIPFEIEKRGHVRLDIYNILGQRVITLVDEERPAGLHRVQWDGADRLGRGVSAGVYIYRLSAGNWHDARKLMLLDGAAGRASVNAEGFSGEAASHTLGVKITGEEILPATFTWGRGSGPLVAEVKGIEDLLPPEVVDSKTGTNPFSGTSLASIFQVVSGR